MRTSLCFCAVNLKRFILSHWLLQVWVSPNRTARESAWVQLGFSNTKKNNNEGGGYITTINMMAFQDEKYKVKFKSRIKYPKCAPVVSTVL